MPVVSITLPASVKAAVDRRIAGGQYASSAEYLCDLVRRDERRRRNQSLEDKLLGRLDQTRAVTMDTTDFNNIRRAFLKRVAGEKQP